MEAHEDKIKRIEAKKKLKDFKRLRGQASEAKWVLADVLEPLTHSERIRWQRRLDDLEAELTALRAEEVKDDK
jgi:hypothetical protein